MSWLRKLVEPKREEPQDTSPQELLSQKASCYILDVREEAEYLAGHIEGSFHIALGRLHQHFDDLPRDVMIAVVCESGERSSSATYMLRQAGFRDVRNLIGGIQAWTRAGLPIAKLKAVTICSHPGCVRPVSRPGHTLCHEHWKLSRAAKATPAPQPVPSVTSPAVPQPAKLVTPEAPIATLSASQLEKQLNLPAHQMNRLLAELGLIERQGQGWKSTAQGQALGALQRYHAQTHVPFVVWPESILQHKALLAIKQGNAQQDSAAQIADQQEKSFRERYPATLRTIDGHMVRSRAEVLIDNWLYMAELVHAYERRLPIEEEVYCDFYLPSGKVYIEYWGLEHDEAYRQRHAAKVAIYKKHQFYLIELSDEHIRSLDDHLPQMLLKYGIRVT